MNKKYGDDVWGWVSKRVPKYRSSGFWSVISSFGDESNVRGQVFVKGLGYMVGEGVKVRVWNDEWELVLYVFYFLEYLGLCPTKRLECFLWVGNVVSWDISFRRSLHQSELVEH